MTTSTFDSARLLAIAAVLAVVAAACSSGDATDPVDGNADAGYSLAFDDGSAGPPEETDDDEEDDESDDVDERSEDYLHRVLEALEAAEAGPPDTATISTTRPADASSGGGAPSSGASSPISGSTATTIGGGGGGDTAIYTGVLGRLGRDEAVVAPRAPAPSVAAGHLPLTGLPGEVPNRPAAVVKVDNGRPARPQTGLNSADIVVEEEVEGGVTRFAAVFHSTSTAVGPVRSSRTTDIGIINGFGSPLLLYSGANAVTDTLIRNQPTVQNRSAATSSGYWRSSARRAPSNLYSDTGSHWASATGGPPPAQFSYRSDGDPVGGVDDASLTVTYRASHAGWNWDGTKWLRTQGGAAHLTASGPQISAANVVVVEAREVATGMVDSSGATVPEFVFVGEGKATVFTAGKRIEGVWNRPTLASVATLTTADGSVIKLTPGRTWIELIRAGAGMLR
ncbi:MAG: DUF3048 domain-containing protein [Acidimicrobiia bacterium]|nr:DUF3048 domain-containing protein [Acidimicrobiia bacterium]